MSALHTNDHETAKTFYRALFGWEAEPFGLEITLFRLPGYVGGEPGQPVPRDVVAAMMTTDAQPGWSVDVWVADADHTAVTAVELGGAARIKPHKIPGFRNAVIADPQGAEMSVSQLLIPAETPNVGAGGRRAGKSTGHASERKQMRA